MVMEMHETGRGNLGAARPRREAGFSLVEMLIALAILLVGVAGAFQLFPRSMRQARQAQELQAISELADSNFGRVKFSGARSLWLGNLEFDTALRLVNGQGQYLYDGYVTSVTRVGNAAEQYASSNYLQRVVFSVVMPDGRREQFVTYVTEP
ncbi:MAG: hypothetical protein AMXMBFR84_02310 [Candidatus Hydrogenedentota bacterium]